MTFRYLKCSLGVQIQLGKSLKRINCHDHINKNMLYLTTYTPFICFIDNVTNLHVEAPVFRRERRTGGMFWARDQETVRDTHKGFNLNWNDTTTCFDHILIYRFFLLSAQLNKMQKHRWTQSDYVDVWKLTSIVPHQQNQQWTLKGTYSCLQTTHYTLTHTHNKHHWKVSRLACYYTRTLLSSYSSAVVWFMIHNNTGRVTNTAPYRHEEPRLTLKRAHTQLILD